MAEAVLPGETGSFSGRRGMRRPARRARLVRRWRRALDRLEGAREVVGIAESQKRGDLGHRQPSGQQHRRHGAALAAHKPGRRDARLRAKAVRKGAHAHAQACGQFRHRPRLCRIGADHACPAPGRPTPRHLRAPPPARHPPACREPPPAARDGVRGPHVRPPSTPAAPSPPPSGTAAKNDTAAPPAPARPAASPADPPPSGNGYGTAADPAPARRTSAPAAAAAGCRASTGTLGRRSGTRSSPPACATAPDTGWRAPGSGSPAARPRPPRSSGRAATARAAAGPAAAGGPGDGCNSCRIGYFPCRIGNGKTGPGTLQWAA